MARALSNGICTFRRSSRAGLDCELFPFIEFTYRIENCFVGSRFKTPSSEIRLTALRTAACSARQVAQQRLYITEFPIAVASPNGPDLQASKVPWLELANRNRTLNCSAIPCAAPKASTRNRDDWRWHLRRFRRKRLEQPRPMPNFRNRQRSSGSIVYDATVFLRGARLCMK